MICCFDQILPDQAHLVMDKRTQCTLLLARSAALGIIVTAAAIFVTRENSDRQIASRSKEGEDKRKDLSLDAESSGRRDIAAHSRSLQTH